MSTAFKVSTTSASKHENSTSFHEYFANSLFSGFLVAVNGTLKA